MVKLTKRETEVAELVIQGHTSKQIAEMLFITDHTINMHMRHLYQKFNLTNSEIRSTSVQRLRFAYAFMKSRYNVNFNFIVSNPCYPNLYKDNNKLQIQQ